MKPNTLDIALTLFTISSYIAVALFLIYLGGKINRIKFVLEVLLKLLEDSGPERVVHEKNDVKWLDLRDHMRRCFCTNDDRHGELWTVEMKLPEFSDGECEFEIYRTGRPKGMSPYTISGKDPMGIFVMFTEMVYTNPNFIDIQDARRREYEASVERARQFADKLNVDRKESEAKKYFDSQI